MLKNKIKILAISGSLRVNSSNARMLQAMEKKVSQDAEFFIYTGLAGLPHFDDAAEIPLSVKIWRKHLQDADAVLVCSPEYAFGVPGSLKNAFDWTVGSGELVNKPLALVTASTGGEKAHAAWLQIFTALSAKIPEEGALLIQYVRSKINAAGEITDPATALSVKKLLDNLVQFVVQQQAAGF
ncbi:MAG: NADPH-dependent FMN reductase [Bacteroidota bacterium]